MFDRCSHADHKINVVVTFSHDAFEVKIREMPIQSKMFDSDVSQVSVTCRQLVLLVVSWPMKESASPSPCDLLCLFHVLLLLFHLFLTQYFPTPSHSQDYTITHF